jgi:serine protease AprX
MSVVIRIPRHTPRSAVTAAVLLIASLTFEAPANAQGRRARLSADLAQHLAAGSSSIDVIVHGTRAEVEALARKYNLHVKRILRSGGVLRVTAGQLAALQDDGSQEHLSADVPIRSIANVTAESIGADQVWAGSERLPPLTGAGVTVAVIDSGVDPRHSSLQGRIAYTVDFTGGDGVDRYGHGTHVAALIAGRQGRTIDTADFRGIASGARIVNLRVLGDDGSGMSSDVIEAIDWVVENRKLFDIRVINLSLGAPVTQPYRDDPMCEAVQRAAAAGIVVVAAAGNYGLNLEGQTVYGSIATPANDPTVITVGAVDTHDTAQRSDDTVARFSSRGPTRFDLVLKPDLVAPGARVVSAEAAGSYLGRTYPQRHVIGAGANAYIQLSGTSMAAGIVSGAVALLLEQKPRLTAREAKAVLQLTSTLLNVGELFVAGAGNVNLVGAIELLSKARTVVPRAGASREPLSDEFAFDELFDTLAIRMNLAHYGATQDVRADLETPAIWWVFRHDTTLAGPCSDAIACAAGGDTIVWGTGGDTIVWGTGGETIVWGTGGETIVWGTSGDSISWESRSEGSLD